MVTLVYISGDQWQGCCKVICVRMKGFKQKEVNCLMNDFRKYWTRMKIYEESQKKQID